MRRCCSDALVYSNKTGAMYFGHPGESIPGPDAGTRANYTILRSTNEGASCETPSHPILPVVTSFVPPG